MMRVSDKGLAFIAAHEGFRSNAYYDPVGIVTIGYGFTMRGKAFADYWKRTRNRGLRISDKIAREEADDILRLIIERDYGKAVNDRLGQIEQHQFDAAVSFVFNVGPRGLKWRWAQSLAEGNIKDAAKRLRNTATTAQGKKLRGLVRRRKEEADLLLNGKYKLPSGAKNAKPVSDALVVKYQSDLKVLKYYNGPIDGILGVRTEAALRSFQVANPPLDVDGIYGPETAKVLNRLVYGIETGRDPREQAEKPASSWLIEMFKLIAGLFGGKR